MSNKTEIERKFFVKSIPSVLSDPVLYERYYLVRKGGVEVRIQKKGDKYEFERKVESNNLARTGQKLEITRTEFEELKKLCDEAILRESYLLPDYEDGSLKVYKGKYDGLVRAEFEFDSEEDANAFVKPEWVGEEITDSSLGRDSRLLGLTEEEFRGELKKYE